MTTSLFDLSGKIALVSGASRGIGESIAKLLAEQGAHIIVSSRNKPGALFTLLDPFRREGISLTRIDTRPSRTEKWAYVFFIEFDEISLIPVQLGEVEFSFFIRNGITYHAVVLVNNLDFNPGSRSRSRNQKDEEGIDDAASRIAWRTDPGPIWESRWRWIRW